MRRRNAGAASVEFAAFGVLTLLLVFGVMEFARAFFVFNTLTEATRRGVRVAVVCPIDDPTIKRITIFNDSVTPGASPALSGLTTANVLVNYLDINGNLLDCGALDCTGADFTRIRYVQVAITGYQHTLLLPAPFGSTFAVPAFESTLPRESLGVVPNVGSVCPYG